MPASSAAMQAHASEGPSMSPNPTKNCVVPVVYVIYMRIARVSDGGWGTKYGCLLYSRRGENKATRWHAWQWPSSSTHLIIRKVFHARRLRAELDERQITCAARVRCGTRARQNSYGVRRSRHGAQRMHASEFVRFHTRSLLVICCEGVVYAYQCTWPRLQARGTCG